MHAIIQKAIERYPLKIDGIHGMSHWKRVRENGLKLASMTGADRIVIEHFAYLHDCCREDEGLDHGHGARAAEFILSIRGALNLTDIQFDLLYEACRDHNNGRIEGDITVMTCWDADRLDLPRVGIRPLRSRLCTTPAKDPEFIEWASLRAVAS